MEDREIVELFWARDEGAIPAAQERYGARLTALTERLLGSSQDAEECVNDTWLRAWRAIPPERPENLFAYLVRVCRNLALDRLDRRSAQKRAGELLTAELETCVPPALQGRDTAQEALGEALTAFLESLPADPRRVFLRRYWFGDSIRDIARRYGYGESKVKVLLLRLRRRLRAYLEKEGISL